MVAGGGVPPVDRHRGDVSLDHDDAEQAVADALGGHDRPGQDEAIFVILGLDFLGGGKQVGEMDLATDQIGDHRTQLLGGIGGSTVDGDVLGIEHQFLGRPWHRCAPGRLNGQIDVGRR